MRVEREVGGPLSQPPPPPSPPRPRPPTDDEDLDGDDDPSLNTAEWDVADAKSKASSTSGTSAVVVSSGPVGQKMVAGGPTDVAGQVAPVLVVAPALPAVDTPRMLRRESAPLLMELDQYGSNLLAASLARSGAGLICGKFASPCSGKELMGGGRVVGSGITAAESPIPSATSTPGSGTPCSSPPVRSAASIMAHSGRRQRHGPRSCLRSSLRRALRGRRSLTT